MSDHLVIWYGERCHHIDCTNKATQSFISKWNTYFGKNAITTQVGFWILRLNLIVGSGIDFVHDPTPDLSELEQNHVVLHYDHKLINRLWVMDYISIYTIYIISQQKCTRFTYCYDLLWIKISSDFTHISHDYFISCGGHKMTSSTPTSNREGMGELSHIN